MVVAGCGGGFVEPQWNCEMAREYTMEGYHDTKMIWRLPSMSMMSGGDLDGDTKMMETRP